MPSNVFLRSLSILARHLRQYEWIEPVIDTMSIAVKLSHCFRSDHPCKDVLLSLGQYHIICISDYWASFAWSNCWLLRFFYVVTSKRKICILVPPLPSKSAGASTCWKFLGIECCTHSWLCIPRLPSIANGCYLPCPPEAAFDLWLPTTQHIL